jgi:hypothetical protein
LASIGGRILAAPSAERINEILGEKVVSDPEPSKSELRRDVRAERRKLKVESKAARKAKRTANRVAKRAPQDAPEPTNGSGD